MQNIIVRHLSGSKAGQVEQFAFDGFNEITIGRHPSSTVKYDLSMVGRLHAKITRDPSDLSQFIITDLNSRNGVFVNKQQIAGRVRILPGDTVRLGPAGPEFTFDVEPRVPPVAPIRITKSLDELLPDSDTIPPHQARTEAGYPSGSPGAASTEAFAPVGRNTLEMLIARTRNESRKYMLVGGSVLITIIAILAGILIYQNVKLQQIARDVGQGANRKEDPASAGGTFANANASGETADPEMDPERTSWRIAVKPYSVLGSGRPGNAAADFDKPDGVAFTPDGLLLATDAKNRRVQVWDVKTGARLGEFGQEVLGSEIVDIAVAPDGTVLITDRALNLASAFARPKPGEADENGKPLGPYDYQFQGTRLGEQGFDKLGAIAIDSRGRIYVVDLRLNDVRRFNADYTPDKSWKFERERPGGDTYLHGCEGMAIDEGAGNLYLASEKDGVVQVFDWETGAYKRKLIGADLDAAGVPSGQRVFYGSVQGLAIAQRHLLAVDESAGHIQIFDLSRPDVMNADLIKYASTRQDRSGGYKGFFGHAPIVNFEDTNKPEIQQQVKEGSVIPGQANPPGYFCSPSSIASYLNNASGETYVAIADRCNYRLVVYRWADISQSLGGRVAAAEAGVKTNIPAKSTGTAKTKATGKTVGRGTIRRAVPRPRVRRFVRSDESDREVKESESKSKKNKGSKKSKQEKQ